MRPTPGDLAERVPPLSAVFSQEELGALLSAFELHEINAGEALIAEGTADADLYLVWDGQLDVHTDTPFGPRHLRKVGVGSFLGEISLLDPGPATASVVAEQGCTALRMSRDRLDSLCATHPGVARRFLRQLTTMLADRLCDVYEQLDTNRVIAGVDRPPSFQGLVAGQASLVSDGGH